VPEISSLIFMNRFLSIRLDTYISTLDAEAISPWIASIAIDET
jgi:hypothetical protein